MVPLRQKAESSENSVKTDGSESNGTTDRRTRTGWEKKASTICDWPIRHRSPKPIPKLKRRTTKEDLVLFPTSSRLLRIRHPLRRN